jgi:hypothetical protein
MIQFSGSEDPMIGLNEERIDLQPLRRLESVNLDIVRSNTEID